MYSGPVNNKKDTKIEEVVEISKVVLDTSVMTSLAGKGGVHENKLYFLDRITGVFYYYDCNGKFMSKHLGVGRSNRELPYNKLVEAHTWLADKSLCIYGPSDDIYVFDENFKRDRKRTYRIPRRDLKEHAYTDFERYSFMTPRICRSYKNYTFIANASWAKDFNYTKTTKKYINNFRLLTEQDLINKKSGRLLGIGLPDMYKEDSHKYSIFSGIFFDINSKGRFYVTFESDSLIYLYNKDYEFIKSYGFKGRNMNDDYMEIFTIEEIRQNIGDESKYKGYYTWLEYIEELDMVFRSYYKGAGELKDGLQIYKDGILIGDIDIPIGFKPNGYIKPYIYSEPIVDQEKEQLFIYKIKI